MGAGGSKELEKTLLAFGPDEKAHLLKLFSQLSSENKKQDQAAIDELAFTEFGVLLPEEYRVSLYHSIMKNTNPNHTHENINKIEFLTAIKSIVRGTTEDKGNFCFDWEGKLKDTIEPEQLRRFVSMVASTAIGIHPLKASEKYHYQVSEEFVDLIVKKPYVEKPSYLKDPTTVKEESELKTMNRGEFIDWYGKNQLFMKLTDLIFIRMFMRSRDIYISSSSPNLLDLESNRKVKREKGLNPPILDNLSELLKSEDVWLLSMHVPPECRHNWKLLYSQKNHGKSWSRFSANVLEKGATLTIIQDEDDHVFGGFAFESLKKIPNFYGSPSNFLFSLTPQKRIYIPSGYNQNYQYMNFGTKTLPNGLGFGGQFQYFGLWINEDFETGHSKAKPLSTTYNSPRLSAKEEFTIKYIEVWCLLEPGIDPNMEDPKSGSVLDQFKEDRVILELAGKTQHSKNLQPEEKNGREDSITANQPAGDSSTTKEASQTQNVQKN